MEGSKHLPVLLSEVLQFLQCQPGRIYVDGTVGSGGHARAILERSWPSGKLIGLDWDEEAIGRAKESLADFGRRVELREENFKNLRSVLDSLSITAVDGILLDLGVSTEQLEDQKRGFSFRLDGPLDMRMSRKTKTTAQELLQRLSVAKMREFLRQYGEERWAQRITKAIARRRQISPIRTSQDLVQVIERSVPPYRGRIHPATRTFQALRIAVNDELHNLKIFLDQCSDLLVPGGRLCIISFHSLEDRIVKDHFSKWAKGQRGTPPSFGILTPKPVVPSREEIFSNPRARSAKLRVAEKISANMKGGSDGRDGL